MWIIEGKDIYYNKFAQVTFLCPMRFERYPLDEHICKFRVGSTNMDINYMRFGETALSFDKTGMNTILDYKIEATQLRQEDRILLYQGQNYSVTGFEIKFITFCFINLKLCTISVLKSFTPALIVWKLEKNCFYKLWCLFRN